MNQLQNIIFDLGGVIVDLERNNAVSALESLGISNADNLLGLYGQKGAFLKLETGEYSEADFYDELLSQCEGTVSNVKLRDAFEAFIIGIPAKRLQILESLKEKGFRLFALSNTNPLMFNHLLAAEFKKEGKTINDYFEGIVTSFQEGICKPDPEIFKRLIKRYNLDPNHTVMLDDSAENCNTAESIGLKAIKIEKEGDNSFDSVCRKFLKQTNE